MPSKKKSLSIDKELVKSLDHLNDSIQRFSMKYSDVPRSLGLYFLRGVLYGLGFLFAIAIVIPVVVWLLQWVEWVPLIGDFVAEIVKRMQEVTSINGSF